MALSDWNDFARNPPEYGVEVLAHAPEWIDPDFNENGVRIGFYTDQGKFTSARWNNDQDTYVTEDEEDFLPLLWLHIPSPFERKIK